MYNTIKYVYGSNRNGDTFLLGTKLFYLEDDKMVKKEFYVGKRFDIEDIICSRELAYALGITDTMVLLEQYKRFNATGIIYFPQTHSYEFLEESDEVVPFTNVLTIQESLEEAIAPVKQKAIASSTPINEDMFELDDPMLELRNMTLSRVRNESNR